MPVDWKIMMLSLIFDGQFVADNEIESQVFLSVRFAGGIFDLSFVFQSASI